MDWDDLRLFLALARAKRLGGAAMALGVNPTTLSRRIRRLEQTLETTLFETSLAGYELTASGTLLLVRAERIESDAIKVAQISQTADRAISGTIRLSTAEGFGTHVLAPSLASFTGSHPDVTVDLIASTGFLNPSRREADLAIMLSRPRAGPLIVRKLTSYTLGLFAHESYIARSGVPTSRSDLLDVPLVGYVPDLIYAPELDYLSELDTRLSATIRSSSINAQAELVASGAGCGILPCFIGQRMEGLIRLLPEEASINRSFWLVVHRDVRKLPRIELFLQWLEDTVTQSAAVLAGHSSSVAAG